MRSISLFLIMILLFTVLGLAADTAATEEQKPAEEAPMPSFFDEVTVTATGSERNVFDIATPVTVISEEKIQQKGAENPADLLREQPGVDVNGVGPNQIRPIIRGQRGLRVLFLENGLRLNNPRRQTDFGEIGGLVDLHNVASIEVVRGPASVLYGSDAIGGVMNAVTAAPHFNGTSNVAGYVEANHSSAGDLSGLSAGIDAKFGRFTLQVGGTRRESENYAVPSGRFGAIDLNDSTNVLDTGLSDSRYWGGVTFTPAAGHTLRLSLQSYDAEETGFGYLPAEKYGATEEARVRILYPEHSFDRALLSYSGTLRRPWADSTNIQLYRQSNARELVNDIDIDIGPVAPGFPHSDVSADSLNYSDLDTWGLRADAVKIFGDGRHVLTYGFEAVRDESFNTDFSTTTTTIRTPYGNQVVTESDGIANAPNATNFASGVFAQDEVSIGQRLSVTAGIRFNNVDTAAKETPGWNISGLDFSDHQFAGALSAKYQLMPSINLLASWGRGFRAPNIIERLFNGATPEGSGYQILNTELESETSDNYDLGLKYSRDNAFMEVVGFQNDIHGGMVQDYLSALEISQLDPETQAAIADSHARFVVQERNMEQLRYRGVELALGWRSSRGIVLGGNATWIDGERVDTAVPIGDTYSNKLFAYARYEPAHGRYWLEYHVRRNGEVEANLDPDSPVPAVGATLPSFTVHGAGAGARLFHFGGMANEVVVWVENLTDALYAEFSNATFFRPEPGRTAKISYRVSF